MNQKLDWFFNKASNWQKAYGILRNIVLDSGLTEELKWGVPCYTFQGNNIVLIHGFKEYCALLFHKGVLLDDPKNLLIQQTENVQAARQLRFTDVKEITELEGTIRAYIFEAIEVEKLGLEIKLKKTSEFKIPKEFEDALDNNSHLKTAFNALTPGRQRGYLLFFSKAKQSKTRVARIEKHIPDILVGKGLKD